MENTVETKPAGKLTWYSSLWMYIKESSGKRLGILFLVTGLIITSVFLVSGRFVCFLFSDIEVLTVTGKDHKFFNGKDMNMIQTDRGAYKNVDNIFYFKTRSYDLQSELQPGKTYRCKTVGIRWGWKSWFKNLIWCEPTE